MPMCPVKKKSEFIVTLTKHPPFRHHFAPPLAQSGKIVTCEIIFYEFGLRMPVKYNSDPLRFAGVIHEKPILS